MDTGTGQQNSNNTITFDFANQPEVAEIFSHKEIGDTCKLTIEFTVVNKNQDRATGRMKEITAHDYKEGKGEEKDKTVEMDPDEPVSVVFKSRGSKEKAPSSEPDIYAATQI